MAEIYMNLKEALCGVSVTTATPFTHDLKNVDLDAIGRNLSYLRSAGIGMVVPSGNTGEFYSLSEREWAQVVEATVNAAGNEMVVMAGVGQSTSTAIRMIQQAENFGVDGVMVMYPQHVFRSEEGILRYYSELLDIAKEVDVVLYKKGPLLSDAVLEKLIGHERLVGAKYAHGRIVDFTRTVQQLGNSIVWSCGTAERFAPFFWLAGAKGFTSGLGNFAPTISLGMMNALKEEDYPEAMRFQELISPLEFLREGRDNANNVPVIKSMMDHVGLSGGSCRPPLHDLNDDEKKAAISAIKGWRLPSSKMS
ncbi:dihydrodipicolinate synthase family protein [Candidatus Thorarchaeota archaeon]|nr:MAG: dihydrodipicolinate synthase family protein [Candidatus Thorarchaeota archaeon]